MDDHKSKIKNFFMFDVSYQVYIEQTLPTSILLEVIFVFTSTISKSIEEETSKKTVYFCMNMERTLLT